MKTPSLGLGTWQLKGRICEKDVRMALEIGYRHIDTAAAYENEKEIGKAIADFPREQLFITSKIWRSVENPKDAEKACDATLKDLNISYLDLYLIHWPNKNNYLEFLAEMEKLQKKGKIRSVGISNATIHHLQEAIKAKLAVANNQVEFHPFLNQNDLLDFCKAHQIELTAYCPLGRGTVFKNPTLKKIGKVHGKSAGQVSLKWLLQKGIIAIPKASSEQHLRENFNIFDFELSAEEMAEIETLDTQGRIICPEQNEFSY